MKASTVGIVYRKEMLDVLRDRRTLFSAILLPLVILPVIIIGVIGLTLRMITKMRSEEAPVMILGGKNAPELTRKVRREHTLDVVPAAADYVRRINEKRLRAAIEFPENLEERVRTNPAESIPVKIYYYEGELRSQEAARSLERVVNDYCDRVVEGRFEERKLSTALTKPFETDRENVVSAEKVSGNILGLLLPYFIISLCMTGAIYPAIDLTAGEKERGTIETILASPVHRGELVIGKFLVVFSVAVSTAALSIVSLSTTAIGAVAMLQRRGAEIIFAISVKAAAAVFFLILPLGIVISAVLLAVALMARNYREAQSYTMPLIFVVIFPAMASFLPGVELNARLALVPILNVSLAAKEILAGNYPWPQLSLIFLSTLAYGAAALYLTYRQFLRESVLFRS